jgi:hypothetical protein
MKQTYQFLCVAIFLHFNIAAFAQAGGEKQRVYTSKSDNQACLNCHGTTHYHLRESESDPAVKKRMSPYHIIDTVDYYQSNHYDFRCFDCHTDEYTTFPHPLSLRFEQVSTCMDCHGGDEVFASYNFEGIEEQVQQSIHFSLTDSGFSCYSCHDAHTYLAIARNEKNISEVVRRDNLMCLKCHGNNEQFGFYSSSPRPELLEKHDWLPNQANHFQSVRCIDCHAEFSKTTLISHNIQPKEKAQKNCVSCHSANSILAASLYRHTRQEERSEKGFWAGLFSEENSIDTLIASASEGNRFSGTFNNPGNLNQNFIIGANRNKVLNLLSIMIFGAAVVGILLHGLLRYSFNQKKSN